MPYHHSKFLKLFISPTIKQFNKDSFIQIIPLFCNIIKIQPALNNKKLITGIKTAHNELFGEVFS